MIPLPEWHPMVVHFPLALVSTGTLALSASRLVRTERYSSTLATVGTWNLCLGAIGALLALATGLAAVLSVELGAAARQAVALHVKWAMLTSMLLLLLTVWRAAGQAAQARPSRLFLVLVWAMTAALMVTGYRGGQNVYRYGIGVSALHAAVPVPRSSP